MNSGVSDEVTSNNHQTTIDLHFQKRLTFGQALLQLEISILECTDRSTSHMGESPIG